MRFLDTSTSGLWIADQVGFGKTIQAGLVWTELRAGLDVLRLLFVCQAIPLPMVTPESSIAFIDRYIDKNRI